MARITEILTLDQICERLILDRLTLTTAYFSSLQEVYQQTSFRGEVTKEEMLDFLDRITLNKKEAEDGLTPNSNFQPQLVLDRRLLGRWLKVEGQDWQFILCMVLNSSFEKYIMEVFVS